NSRRDPPQAVFHHLQPAWRTAQCFLYSPFGRSLESGMGARPVLVSLQRSRARGGDLLREETSAYSRASADAALLDGSRARPDPSGQSISATGRRSLCLAQARSGRSSGGSALRGPSYWRDELDQTLAG